MTEADIERPFGEGEPDPHYGVIYMANAEDARFFGTYANCTGVSYHDTGRKSGRWREPGVYFCDAHER